MGFSLDLIVSQGCIADRTPGAIAGAALTSAALERVTAQDAFVVTGSTRTPHADWRESLPQARETLSGLRNAVAAGVQRGRVPLLAANTCSASLASLPVAAAQYPDMAVLWIDAHGDFNTPETTDTGYLGGMVLAAACGLWDSGYGAGVQADRVILAGARDIDAAERESLERAGVRILPPAECEPATIVQAVGTAPVWIHIDWDSLEPGIVPAAYKVPGGLLPAQVKDILSALAASSRIVGVELAEFEASGDGPADERAVGIILDVLGPLLERSAATRG